MTKCWRCGRTDTERREEWVQTKSMTEEQLLESCLDLMDCIRTRFDDNKPGPSRGDAVAMLYQAEYDAHRDCGPDCLTARLSLGHLIASRRRPETP
jgi:hypothetical protein